ncbi:DUF6309 family protein [Kitasatospora sp. GP82]|uniref:DUF6309 family protein n=1 Tax=Kitasatospora sp. GP82 TaxID=3035089 RepID=UPI00247328D1|nr:DUF6309 family protein [Kitasatospora sp. GP82]MDH6125000.1 hypothetical protein [Kitasatospora sp. GP82]
MKVVSSVTFAEVQEIYLGYHPVGQTHEANTNQDGEENLQRAEQLLGSWWGVRLSRAEVLDVMLPWHLSEGGKLELVPRAGLTVGQAAERVRSGGAEWAEANPVCAAKLELLKSSPLTPVYLSTLPVPHSDYSDLRLGSGLVHLDGLHRMIAWELARRLPHEERLEAFVAGDVRTHLDAGDRSTIMTPPAQTGDEQT